MASSVRFRVRAPNGGQKTLDPMPSSNTMEQLQTLIINKLELSNIKPGCIQIKFVFPPPRIISECDPSTTLSSLKLTSGNLIISILDKPPEICILAQKKKKEEKKKKQEEKKEEIQNKKQPQLQEKPSGTIIKKVIESDNSCLFNAILFVAEEGTESRAKSIELREIIASIVLR